MSVSEFVKLACQLQLVSCYAQQLRSVLLFSSQADCMSPCWPFICSKYCLTACEKLVAHVPGILVPDIPLEETGEIREAASKAGMELVLLTTPTTPRERMQAIAKASQGFVYLVSVTGATQRALSSTSITVATSQWVVVLNVLLMLLWPALLAPPANSQGAGAGAHL